MVPLSDPQGNMISLNDSGQIGGWGHSGQVQASSCFVRLAEVRSTHLDKSLGRPRVDNCFDGCKASLGHVSQLRITVGEDQHACPVSTQSVSQLKVSKVSSEINVFQGQIGPDAHFRKNRIL